MMKARRQRRIEQLTKQKEDATIDLSEVETVSDDTGKCSDKEVVKSNPESDKIAEVV